MQRVSPPSFRPTREVISAAGRGVARLCDEHFKTWALREAVERRPRQAIVMIGGNDLAAPRFRQQLLVASFQELALGLLAAGAERVPIFPIPPRDSFRSGDVLPQQYRRRRRVTNKILKVKFRKSPVKCLPFVVPDGFLARDGVHPSAPGWETILAALRAFV